MEPHQTREYTARKRVVTPYGGAFDDRVTACRMAGVVAGWLDGPSIEHGRQTRERP
jgi:hypothetical protein